MVKRYCGVFSPPENSEVWLIMKLEAGEVKVRAAYAKHRYWEVFSGREVKIAKGDYWDYIKEATK